MRVLLVDKSPLLLGLLLFVLSVNLNKLLACTLPSVLCALVTCSLLHSTTVTPLPSSTVCSIHSTPLPSTPPPPHLHSPRLTSSSFPKSPHKRKLGTDSTLSHQHPLVVPTLISPTHLPTLSLQDLRVYFSSSPRLSFLIVPPTELLPAPQRLCPPSPPLHPPTPITPTT